MCLVSYLLFLGSVISTLPQAQGDYEILRFALNDKDLRQDQRDRLVRTIATPIKTVRLLFHE